MFSKVYKLNIPFGNELERQFQRMGQVFLGLFIDPKVVYSGAASAGGGGGGGGEGGVLGIPIAPKDSTSTDRFNVIAPPP